MPPRRRAPIIHWNAAIIAGIVAGAAMLAVEMLFGPAAFGGSAVDAPRRMASIIMGPSAVTSTAAGTALVVGFLVQVGLSVAAACILALFLRRASVAAAAAIGLGFGLALYFFDFYLMASVLPWVVEQRNWVNVAAHLVFGASAGVVYAALARKRTTGAVLHHRYEETYAA